MRDLSRTTTRRIEVPGARTLNLCVLANVPILHHAPVIIASKRKGWKSEKPPQVLSHTLSLLHGSHTLHTVLTGTGTIGILMVRSPRFYSFRPRAPLRHEQVQFVVLSFDSTASFPNKSQLSDKSPISSLFFSALGRTSFTLLVAKKETT